MKNKTTAALLAFFLGGIGIQYFYLGKTIKGVLCLLFCWTLIPCIIALYHVIKFLVMSDAAFNAQYNQQYALVAQPVTPAAPTQVTPSAPAVRSTPAIPVHSMTTAPAASTRTMTEKPDAAVSTADELQKLFNLKQQGALTEEEYIVRKARLLV